MCRMYGRSMLSMALVGTRRRSTLPVRVHHGTVVAAGAPRAGSMQRQRRQPPARASTGARLARRCDGTMREIRWGPRSSGQPPRRRPRDALTPLHQPSNCRAGPATAGLGRCKVVPSRRCTRLIPAAKAANGCLRGAGSTRISTWWQISARLELATAAAALRDRCALVRRPTGRARARPSRRRCASPAAACHARKQRRRRAVGTRPAVDEQPAMIRNRQCQRPSAGRGPATAPGSLWQCSGRATARSARPTASASWVPEPNPACAGSAAQAQSEPISAAGALAQPLRQATMRSSSACAAGASAMTASSLADEITTSDSNPSITRPTLPKRSPERAATDPESPRCNRPGRTTRIAAGASAVVAAARRTRIMAAGGSRMR